MIVSDFYMCFTCVLHVSAIQPRFSLSWFETDDKCIETRWNTFPRFLCHTSSFSPSKFQRSTSISKPVSNSINFSNFQWDVHDNVWYTSCLFPFALPFLDQFPIFELDSQFTCPCRSPNFVKVRIPICINLYIFSCAALCSIAVSFSCVPRFIFNFKVPLTVYRFKGRLSHSTFPVSVPSSNSLYSASEYAEWRSWN